MPNRRSPAFQATPEALRVSETSRRRKMRIDFLRRGVFLSIGLVVTGTLLTSDLMATPAHAFVRHPAYGRSIDRQAITRTRDARLQRASRSGTRSRIVPAPGPTTPPKPVFAPAGGGDDLLWQ